VKVTTTYEGPGAVVHIDGRLDAEWASHLASALDDLLRAGVRSVVVDLSVVSYVSSAGARVLITSAQEFAALRGELLIATPPPAVIDALGDAGLEDRVVHPVADAADGRLFVSDTFEARVRPTRDWRAPATRVSRGRYETFAPEPGAALTCRLYGDPARVAHGALADDECHLVAFPERVFGLGIGALGDDYEQCGSRFGELVGAGGVVAFLPTDGARVPDYLTTVRGRAPQALLACGITCSGKMSHLVRFTATHRGESVPLSELAEVCLDAVGADAAGVVMVAEAAGLVGASRRSSPVAAAGRQGFDASVLRDWLTFTAEPAHAGATALITGVIARNVAPPMVPHVRPLDAAGRLLAHLHAAVFSYQPVPQRTVSVERMVGSLFAEEALRAVLHLLTDRRDGIGPRESRFVRGLVWVGRLDGITAMAR
jgi:anti-anti-sigma factor